MPLHDWTRVPSGLFHHFHQFWTTEICRKLHKAIWDQFDREDFELPSHQNRVFVSYESAGEQSAHIEMIGLGDNLPDMPIFIAPDAHVLVPLEETYMNAWQDTPATVRRQVVGPVQLSMK
jgi:hypothetical protein